MKLVDRIAEVGMRRHLSRNTIECYQRWVTPFLRFCAQKSVAIAIEDDPFDIPRLDDDSPAAKPEPSWEGVRRGTLKWRHPHELGAAEVGAFLTHLAKGRRLGASSQNRAVNAIVFLYKQVLAGELGDDHLMDKPAIAVTSPLDRLGR